MELRSIRREDRAPLARLLSRVANFEEEERAVALELIDEAIERPASGYECIVADDGRSIAGYLCFGRTPMTAWTFDLYWVAVDGERQGQGIGKKLAECFEGIVKERG